MRRRIASRITLTLLLASMLTLRLDVQPVEAEPRTWIVDDDGPADFHTIQEAINVAGAGDTIFVYNGEYHENLGVNKAVSLIGENVETTIIIGSTTGEPVKVTARGAKISGLTIRASTSLYASVRLFSSRNSILNNHLTGGWCGIRMEHYSDYNLIANNTIMDNLNGITGEMWHNTKIVGNTVKDNLMGLHIGPYAQNNVISFNNITRNWSEGIMIMQSSNNLFEGNNIIDNNQGYAFAGITIGFQKGFSSGNKFFHNNIANKYRQIELQGEPEPIVWDDGYPSGGNHWRDYADVDLYNGPNQDLLGMDGIWDHPYIIDANNKDEYPLVKPWPTIPAAIDIEPETLNLWGQGKWITAYVQPPQGYGAADINATTILLSGTISPVLDPKYGFVTNSSEYLVDHNEDGVLERMVKFDRADIASWIYESVGMQRHVSLTITGELTDGTPFEGTTTILVFWQGHRPPSKR